MKAYSDNRPQPIEHIGKGNYYVNMDIHEVEESIDGETRVYYECDCVRIVGYPTYPTVVEALIREKYTESDELAILRQRDSKPQEFNEYNTFCEACKDKARPVFYPDETQEGGE